MNGNYFLFLTIGAVICTGLFAWKLQRGGLRAVCAWTALPMALVFGLVMSKLTFYLLKFQGQFDNRVAPGQAESYIACAQKLAQWEEHPRFGHLFASMKALCDVLAIKYDLGVRTRKAYLEKEGYYL